MTDRTRISPQCEWRSLAESGWALLHHRNNPPQSHQRSYWSKKPWWRSEPKNYKFKIGFSYLGRPNKITKILSLVLTDMLWTMNILVITKINIVRLKIPRSELYYINNIAHEYKDTHRRQNCLKSSLHLIKTLHRHKDSTPKKLSVVPDTKPDSLSIRVCEK